MTEAVTPAVAAKAAVSGALRKAADATGVGFDYLYRVAVRESSLDPAAKAKTSSAAGLFQFIEQTWLHAVKQYGAAHGLADAAADIKQDADGRLSVDGDRRKQILDLRFDPEKAAALAAELARENKTSLEGALGRAVDAAELYAAHFLGAGGAKKLLAAKAGDSAAALLPAAAAANRHVFYDGARARTVGEVIDSFRRTIGGAQETIGEIGDRIEKALAPLLRETASFVTPMRLHPEERSVTKGEGEWAPQDEGRLRLEAIRRRPPGLEIGGLSPLVLAVLQALDRRDDAVRQ
jgi:hypothetical protein